MAQTRKRTRRYWLFKSEPDAFSIDDLMAAARRRTHWDGVRNFQARNLLRDEMKRDDGVLYYHSNARPMAVVGIAKIVREGYPDHTAWDPDSQYFDPKADPDDPTWFMVDIEGVCKLREPLTRDELRELPELADMMLLRRGSRLSVQPVSAAEWRAILARAGVRESW